jgi:hypothetical protein
VLQHFNESSVNSKMPSQSVREEACQGQATSNKKGDYDDSDDDSEFDDLLQFQAFSTSTGTCSPPCSKKQKTESGIKEDVDHGSAQDDTSDIQARALKKAQACSVPDGITHPNMLFWYKPSRSKGKKSKRGGTANRYFQWTPCRICSPDEVSGLNLPQNWDSSKKVLVQYVEGTGFALREIVLKNRLVPYHGREGSEDEVICEEQDDAREGQVVVDEREGQFQWCPLAMTEMSNRNRKSRKKFFQDESNVLAVELYLNKVMDTAVERMKLIKVDDEKKQQVLESDDGHMSLPFDSQTPGNDSDTEKFSTSSPNSAIVSQEICENELESSQDVNPDDDDDSTFIKPSDRNKLTLRAGDVIAYYQPNMVFGDKRAYRTARIDEIACKKDMVLKLQGGDYLDRDQRIKRLEKLSRGKLVQCDEPWIHLKNLRLRSGKLKGVQNTGIMEESNRIKRVIERTNEMATDKLKSEGLEMFRSFLK